MTIFDAILQGIIQGLTEFLPVSSSGHLSLVQHFTGQGGEVGGSFSIMLHFGTLVAVMIAFWPTIRDLILEAFRMIGDLFRGKLRFKTDNPRRRMIWMLLLALVPLFAVLPLKDFYSSLAEDDSIIAEGICFLLEEDEIDYDADLLADVYLWDGEAFVLSEQRLLYENWEE